MQIIFNADDFGRSRNINAAVIQAHTQGVLTSASLMVAGNATQEAVTLARQTPTLAVGLHLVVACDKALLPPAEIPRIVDSQGYFPRNPLTLGLRYVFSEKARQELRREITAQFEYYASTGLPLGHVDGHIHMHIHPVVFEMLLPLAEQYGARGIRIPRDLLWPAVRYSRKRMGEKITWAIVFSLLCRWCINRLNRTRLMAARRVFGLMQTGEMQEDYVVALLKNLNVANAEFYFHPSTIFEGEILGPNPGDLATLLSPRLRAVIQARGFQTASYATLTRG